MITCPSIPVGSLLSWIWGVVCTAAEALHQSEACRDTRLSDENFLCNRLGRETCKLMRLHNEFLGAGTPGCALATLLLRGGLLASYQAAFGQRWSRQGLPNLIQTDTYQKLVLLTREAGQNEKLRRILEPQGIRCAEMPVVETIRDSSEYAKLIHLLHTVDWTYVLVTSPAAATILNEAWRDAGKPRLRTVTIGAGTASALDCELQPLFRPQNSNVQGLASELPLPANITQPNLLYPCSAKAKQDKEIALAERGFNVTRLNTYTVQPLRALPRQNVRLARAADVVTFGATSTLDAYVELLGDEALLSGEVGVACIGNVTGESARKRGWSLVRNPEKVGVEGWAQSVRDLVRLLEQRGAQNRNISMFQNHRAHCQ